MKLYFCILLGIAIPTLCFSQSHSPSTTLPERLIIRAASAQSKAAIAQAAADAVAEQLGDLCQKQNQELYSRSQVGCEGRMCLLDSTETHQPAGFIVSVEYKANSSQWFVALQLQWKPATHSSFAMCIEPSMMQITRQTYSDVYFDPRLAEIIEY